MLALGAALDPSRFPLSLPADQQRVSPTRTIGVPQEVCGHEECRRGRSPRVVLVDRGRLRSCADAMGLLPVQLRHPHRRSRRRIFAKAPSR